ncbi:hypothetical protein HanIR_Chr04g0155961 [Helianthus annuus]|nr:hypothetical protein HanIR_Chr04g0155961 [Helianthus annuus]
MNVSRNWDSVVETFKNRLLIWKADKAISSWCKVPPIYALVLKDILELHSVGSSPKFKKAVHVVCLSAIWCIWKARNGCVFKQNRWSLEPGVSLEAASLSSGIEVRRAYILPSPDPINSFAICGIILGMVVVVVVVDGHWRR